MGLVCIWEEIKFHAFCIPFTTLAPYLPVLLLPTRFPLSEEKNHAKNVVSCVLLKLSRFDSLHSGTSIVCFWMPSCSSL